jgi:uncharacterized protein YjeT (DUF2065 family)
MNTKLQVIKVISRIALGLVWFYEGLVPKILFLRADEIDLVNASRLVWRTPQLTLQIVGIAQMLVGFLVDHWICRTSRRSYRDNLDVDLDYPGHEWQSSDAA